MDAPFPTSIESRARMMPSRVLAYIRPVQQDEFERDNRKDEDDCPHCFERPGDCPLHD